MDGGKITRDLEAAVDAFEEQRMISTVQLAIESVRGREILAHSILETRVSVHTNTKRKQPPR